MRLKEVRGRQKQSLVSALVILLLLSLFPGADFDKVKDKSKLADYIGVKRLH